MSNDPTTRLPFSVLANYGGHQHSVSEHDTLPEAQEAMRNIAKGYSESGGGTVHVGDDWHVWVEVDGHAVARFVIVRRPDGRAFRASLVDDERDHNRLIVQHVVSLLVSECALAEVDDYRGEAVNFFGALMAYADGSASTPAEAVRMAYGIGAQE